MKPLTAIARNGGPSVFKIATLSLALACILPSTGLGSEPVERQAEHLRVQAAEIREKAEQLRQEAEAKGGEALRAKAKALDKQADALIEKANRIDPENWPPQPTGK